ncbi:uncharacterized protein LOC119996164 [Tripterygium wilfordii]|uniref:uncharacterized protein LOC119996164 n=1 Tax=Tripterygium wilfordii TaxID=458696 RepID=UPI0018F7E5D8|nr:uncharacterized protein LOC119996164 [Tripterygium wilfordii]
MVRTRGASVVRVTRGEPVRWSPRKINNRDISTNENEGAGEQIVQDETNQRVTRRERVRWSPRRINNRDVSTNENERAGDPVVQDETNQRDAIQVQDETLFPQTQPESLTPSSAASTSNDAIKKIVRGKYKCLNLDLKTKGGKLEIVMPDDIQRAVGKNSRDVVNFCGYIVRSMAPLFVEKEGKMMDAKWEDIVGTIGELMWTQVKEKFMVAEGKQYKFQAFVIDTMRRLYRIWKHRLHEMYKRFETDEERLENVPSDVKSEDWKLLIEYFSSEKFQKISQRNAANRAKLVTKHTCGTRSFTEVEESMRDPISGKKPPPDEIWLKQHTKKSKEGELQWSDPISKEVHEKLHDLVVQQEETPPESQLTNDEMLLQVLGQKSGYFRGKGAGTRPPTKRTRYLENMQEEVQRAVDSARESMIESLRADVSNELKAEIRKTVEMELKNDLTEQIQRQFNAMFQARMAAFLGSSSQSDTSVPTRPANRG